MSPNPFSFQVPRPGLHRRALDKRDDCPLKACDTGGWRMSEERRKEWVMDSSIEAPVSHLCPPLWLSLCCLFLNILSPPLHTKKKRPGNISWVHEHWTWNYTDHILPPRSAIKFAERQGSHLSEHLLGLTFIVTVNQNGDINFFERP